jgi:hypothetical protein
MHGRGRERGLACAAAGPPAPTPLPLHARAQAAAAGAALVATSAELAAALRSRRVSRVALTSNVTLRPADWGWRNKLEVDRGVEVAACGGGGPGSVVLDLGDNLVARVLVRSGGRLAFAGPALALAGAPPVLRHPLWPDYNPLLLGLVDVDGSGSVLLANLTVATRSPANASRLLERYPPGLAPDFAVGARGASAIVRFWDLTHAAYRDAAGDAAVSLPGRRRRLLGAAAGGGGGGGGAGAGARRRRRVLAAPEYWPVQFSAARPPAPAPDAAWRFRNVVLQMPNTFACFADAGIEGFPVSSGAVLRQQLQDPALTHIAVTGDLALDPAAWPPAEANRLKEGKGVNVTHQVGEGRPRAPWLGPAAARSRGGRHAPWDAPPQPRSRLAAVAARPSPLPAAPRPLAGRDPRLQHRPVQARRHRLCAAPPDRVRLRPHGLHRQPAPCQLLAVAAARQPVGAHRRAVGGGRRRHRVRGGRARERCIAPGSRPPPPPPLPPLPLPCAIARPGRCLRCGFFAAAVAPHVNSWPPSLGAPRPGPQGVEIRDDAPSAFHNFDDPFWEVHSDPAYVPNAADFVRLAPPPNGERDVLLVNYTFVKSRWVRASQVRAGGLAVV